MTLRNAWNLVKLMRAHVLWWLNQRLCPSNGLWQDRPGPLHGHKIVLKVSAQVSSMHDGICLEPRAQCAEGFVGDSNDIRNNAYVLPCCAFAQNKTKVLNSKTIAFTAQAPKAPEAKPRAAEATLRPG